MRAIYSYYSVGKEPRTRKFEETVETLGRNASVFDFRDFLGNPFAEVRPCNVHVRELALEAMRRSVMKSPVTLCRFDDDGQARRWKATMERMKPSGVPLEFIEL